MFLVSNNEFLTLLGAVFSAFALGAITVVMTHGFLAAYRRALKGKDLETAFDKRVRDENSLTTLTDTDGRVIDVNDKFLETLGYSRSEVVGQVLEDFYPVEDFSISQDIRTSTRSGKIWTGETRLKCADGSVSVTQTTVVPLIDDKGKHIKNLCVRVDVTEYRASKDEKTVTTAFDKMFDAVIVHDPATSAIVYMNPFGLAEHGWTAQEATGKTLWDTHYMRTSEAVEGLYEKVQKKGKCTMVLESPDHDRVHEARSYTFAVDGGERRLLTIFRDITQNTALERERNHLVSVITHELRTPLTSIKGALRLIDAGKFGPMSTGAKDLVGIALRNSDRMLELIREILDSERRDQASETEPMEPVNLSEAVDLAIDSNLGYGAQLGITLVNQGSTPNVWIEGNEGYIAQILSNLMSNAAKFSPDGASVEIWVSKAGSMAELHVRDHGRGIPQDIQSTLFKRFAGTRQSDRGDVHGSGLGLSIVKTLVDKLGGTIEFETAPGNGTCFHVRFPLLATKRRSEGAVAAAG